MVCASNDVPVIRWLPMGMLRNPFLEAKNIRQSPYVDTIVVRFQGRRIYNRVELLGWLPRQSVAIKGRSVRKSSDCKETERWVGLRHFHIKRPLHIAEEHPPLWRLWQKIYRRYLYPTISGQHYFAKSDK
jgi:hypothetical protein